ncbi:MAG: SagB/ThcOx family dehydrogenase [Turicibacter sp.]|nr:SagB/ThcOx family dehydrogenase [Turicibacter sp.]
MEQELKQELQRNRSFMKCPIFTESMGKSDQSRGLPHPPHGKPTKNPVALLEFDTVPLVEPSYTNILEARRSIRVFDENATITQSQLAFILHTAQGIQGARGKDEAFTLRAVPSGGARHPFETYIAIRAVDGLEPGFYYYAPAATSGQKRVVLEFLHPITNYAEQITDMLVGQKWAAKSQATIFLSCVPYKAEWRYRELAHRVVLIDLGHVGQNIMLSATALGLGSCCIAAYDQQLCDKNLALDGEDEYTVYAVPIGKT